MLHTRAYNYGWNLEKSIPSPLLKVAKTYNARFLYSIASLNVTKNVFDDDEPCKNRSPVFLKSLIFFYFLFGESLHAVCRDERWVSVSSLCCGLDHGQRTMEQLRPCLGLGFGAGWEEGIFLRIFIFTYLLSTVLLL